MVLLRGIKYDQGVIVLIKNKEIYATLEISDQEVRLLVGEFFETRLNLLFADSAKINEIENKQIMSEKTVVNAIMKLVQHANNSLGFHIERVLLAIPSVHVERIRRRVHVPIVEGSKRVRQSHIQQGYNEILAYRPSSESELVNISGIKYIVNGITSHKMPLNEVCEQMTMSVDLLCADKQIVYSYISCVEKAGLEILDICLDSYAAAQEAAILAQTVDKYIVFLNLEQDTTTLSLFSQGRMLSSDVIVSGYKTWFTDFSTQYGLSSGIGKRLLQNGCSLENNELDDLVVYVWAKDGEQEQLTQKQLRESVLPNIVQWIEEINQTCNEIMEQGNVKFMLSGGGFEMNAIESLLKLLKTQYQLYTPQTIGARTSKYTVCLGQFYNWKEQQQIRKSELTSCDDKDVETGLQKIYRKRNTSEESGFTKRLKSILLNDK